MGTLLSIIIPTKNRNRYCIECLKHLKSLNLPDIEIVVQDNSDTNSLKDLIIENNLQDFVKYNYLGGVISFVRNFSIAVEESIGEYVTMIGDDDTVLPNIMDIARRAKANGYDAVIPQLNFYIWPSDKPFKEEYSTGYLASKPFKSKKFQRLDVGKALKDLIIDNFQNYQSHNVPRVYHGIVSKKSLDKVKATAGDYFKGLTPDMFMSVALCFTAPNSFVYSQPVTISGICPTSGSSDSATGRHTGNLSDAPHFRGHKSYDWCKDVPAIYTVETIWAETALQALSLFDDGTYRSLYNQSEFAGYLMQKYPQFRTELCLSAANQTMTSHVIEKMSCVCQKYWDKFVRLATNQYARHYYNVADISAACKLLSKLYKLDK